MGHIKHFFVFWGPVLAWCTLIFYFSHHPVPEPMSESQTFKGVDIIYHFLAYAPLGLLSFRASKHFWFSVLFVFLYGISDELHQSLLPFRDFEIKDMIVNGVAGFCGIRSLSLCRFLSGT
ncbi:MAG: VanZ family protein [Deltaproteobacteria bacterium]|nr:VanZ family protein [Deltaproteobacteria bacterium]